MARTGAITSRFRVQYGYIEARVRMPKTHGMWPAFWMLHQGWPPEIDIFEILTNYRSDGTPNYSFIQNYHFRKDGRNQSRYARHSREKLASFGLCDDPKSGCGEKLTQWHTYGLLWTKNQLVYFVDGKVTHRVADRKIVTDKPGYLIMNLAVGGWARNPDHKTKWDKAHMDVDWVRIWQRE